MLWLHTHFAPGPFGLSPYRSMEPIWVTILVLCKSNEPIWASISVQRYYQLVQSVPNWCPFRSNHFSPIGSELVLISVQSSAHIGLTEMGQKWPRPIWVRTEMGKPWNNDWCKLLFYLEIQLVTQNRQLAKQHLLYWWNKLPLHQVIECDDDDGEMSYFYLHSWLSILFISSQQLKTFRYVENRSCQTTNRRIYDTKFTLNYISNITQFILSINAISKADWDW